MMRTLLRPWLRRLPAPARAALRLAAHPRRETRYLADWMEFRRTMAPIVRALRARGPATGGEVLIHNVHGFVPSLKVDVLHGAMLLASGIRPVFLTTRSGGFERYLRLLPGARVLRWEDYVDEPTPEDARIARAMVADAHSVPDLVRSEWQGVAVGSHVASLFMRSRHLGTIDLREHTESLVGEVARSLAAARASSAVLDRESAATILMTERAYTPFGEFFDVALTRGRRVVQVLSAHRDDGYVFKAYATDRRSEHPFSLSDDSWRQALAMPFGDADRERLVARWQDYYASRTWFNFQRLQHLTKMLTREEVVADLGLDPAKPTAALFAHIFWDATFFYGESLYDDYQHWFVETVRLANRSTGVNWVIKLHPVNVWRLEADGVTGSPYAELTALERAGVRLAPHVKLVMPDTHISSWSLYQVVDVCFTVRGTVGVEMALLGKRVVTAGTAHYSGRGFTADPASRDEYERMVLDPAALAPMSAAEHDRACRLAYWLLERKPYVFDTHRFEYSGAKDQFHPLNGRAHILAPSGEAFVRSPIGAAWAAWMTSSTDVDCLAPAAP